MRHGIILLLIYILFSQTTIIHASEKIKPQKKRILVISSYIKEHKWSQETNKGFCDAMYKFGYFDNKEQISEFTRNDYVETSGTVIKKLWMDSKRKNSHALKDETALAMYLTALDFKPDLIFLGDDNAAQYVGKNFLDTEIPVVFWGINNTPVKYGLVNSKERPGHNVTGVYQSGYFIERFKFLKKIVPGIKTFAILSDSSPTGRSNYKSVKYLAQKNKLSAELIETITTDDYETWKEQTLKLQKEVDAFFIVHFYGLKDKNGKTVPGDEVIRWYLSHIKIPEVSTSQAVKMGLLCTVNDSGYNQGFEAVTIAHDILANGAVPATYPPIAPMQGASTVNMKRAEMLGIKLTDNMGIEEYRESASALKEKRADGK